MNSTSNFDNPSGDSNESYYSTALSFGFLLLMTFIALTAYCCSHRNLQSRQSTSHRTVAMERDISAITIQVLGEEEHTRSDLVLNSFPMLLYSQARLHKLESHSSSTPSCSICLADYKDSEWLRFLPDCGHYFHKECIDMWLRLNMSCPVCRNSPFPTPLPTPLAEVAPLATRRD